MQAASSNDKPRVDDVKFRCLAENPYRRFSVVIYVTCIVEIEVSVRQAARQKTNTGTLVPAKIDRSG